MSPARAAVLVAAGASLFATAGVAQGLGPHVPELQLACLRLLGAGAVFGLLAGRLPLALLRARPVVVAAVAQAVFQVSIFTAFGRVGVAVGTLVAIGLSPLLTGLVARDRSLRWLVSTVVALVGLALLVGTSGTPDVAGLAAAVVAAAALAAYILAIGRPVAGEPPLLDRLATTFAGGGVVLVPFALLAGAPTWADRPTAWALVVFVALVPTVLAYRLYNAGSPHVGAPATATLGLLEPVVAAVLGVLVLGETLTPAGAVGAVLVVAAVLVLVTAPRPAATAPGRL